MNNVDEAEQGTPAQLVFFQRLHKMINAHRSGCVDWLPDGNGFIITNKEGFIEDALSVFFPHAKYNSFLRRLKRWGFVRLPTTSGAFEHRIFRRGMTFDDYDLDDHVVLSPNQLPIKSHNDESSFDIHREEGPPPGPSDAHVIAELMREINRDKRRAMALTSSGGKVEAAQALASMGSSEFVHQENPRGDLQMGAMRMSHEAGALSRALSYSQQMTVDMVQRHHEQYPWRCDIQDFQRVPEYGIDGRESFQHPPTLQRQVLVPGMGMTGPGVSWVSASGNEQPDLASLLRMRRDLDDSKRELMKRAVDNSCCQMTGDSSGRVPLPHDVAFRSPYNRAA